MQKSTFWGDGDVDDSDPWGANDELEDGWGGDVESSTWQGQGEEKALTGEPAFSSGISEEDRSSSRPANYDAVERSRNGAASSSSKTETNAEVGADANANDGDNLDSIDIPLFTHSTDANMRALLRPIVQEGFRAGKISEEAKEMQRGFDAGFAVGMARGRAFGRFYGRLRALSGSSSSGSSAAGAGAGTDAAAPVLLAVEQLLFFDLPSAHSSSFNGNNAIETETETETEAFDRDALERLSLVLLPRMEHISGSSSSSSSNSSTGSSTIEIASADQPRPSAQAGYARLLEDLRLDLLAARACACAGAGAGAIV